MIYDIIGSIIFSTFWLVALVYHCFRLISVLQMFTPGLIISGCDPFNVYNRNRSGLTGRWFGYRGAHLHVLIIESGEFICIRVPMMNGWYCQMGFRVVRILRAAHLHNRLMICIQALIVGDYRVIKGPTEDKSHVCEWLLVASLFLATLMTLSLSVVMATWRKSMQLRDTVERWNQLIDWFIQLQSDTNENWQLRKESSIPEHPPVLRIP